MRVCLHSAWILHQIYRCCLDSAFADMEREDVQWKGRLWHAPMCQMVAVHPVCGRGTAMMADCTRVLADSMNCSTKCSIKSEANAGQAARQREARPRAAASALLLVGGCAAEEGLVASSYLLSQLPASFSTKEVAVLQKGGVVHRAWR